MANEQEKAGRWENEQLGTDDGTGDPLPPPSSEKPADAEEANAVDAQAVDPATDEGDPRGDAPDWNKGQMGTDDAGEGQTWIDPDTMLESEMGATGGRANPGGGQRFGKADDSVPEEQP